MVLAAPGNGMCQGYARWPSPAEARASRSILTRTRRQSAKRELHTAQQLIHRRPATHGGCIQAVARSCGGVPVMHTNAQCKTNMHTRTTIAATSGVARAQSAIPVLPETSKNRGTALLWACDGPLYCSESEPNSHKTSDQSELCSWGTSNELQRAQL